MDALALLLALAAAGVHAGWNLLLAGAPAPRAATAVAAVTGVVAFAPVAALDWRLERPVVPFVVASAALELLYLALLAAAYAVADADLVYPIARGSAPVLVLIAGAVVLHVPLPAAAAAGVVLVGSGAILVRGVSGRADRAARTRGVALALAVGGCIAGYTLVDSRGLAHAAPIAYLEVVMVPSAAAYLLLAWRADGAAALRAAIDRRSTAAGIGLLGAYGLVLLALTRAPAAPVAAVRETSVVMLAVVAGRSLPTGPRRRRLAGAALIVVGVAAIALS
ncbi:MAG: EamA family transporter [Frankiaceae bacterium]